MTGVIRVALVHNIKDSDHVSFMTSYKCQYDKRIGDPNITLHPWVSFTCPKWKLAEVTSIAQQPNSNLFVILGKLGFNTCYASIL